MIYRFLLVSDGSFLQQYKAAFTGDFAFSEMQEYSRISGPLLYVVLIFASGVIMTNLFIAIVSKEYENAYLTGVQDYRQKATQEMAKEILEKYHRLR